METELQQQVTFPSYASVLEVAINEQFNDMFSMGSRL
jgi:hypothetical protein